MSITIKQVQTREDLKRFVKFPFQLYRGNPHWIPPVIKAEMTTLSPGKNPVFDHSEAVLYTAWKEGRMTGRIAGMINHRELAFTGEKHARFGWVDFEDDPEVSAGLLGAVENWAKDKGMQVLKGPYGFNQLDRNGMLTEGFDSTGTVNTIYNYAYYPEHLKKQGYEKELEWVEVILRLIDKPLVKYQRFTEMAKKRYRLKTVQPQSTQEMLEVGDKIFDLLMDTYKELPGFVPISDEQRKSYINRYIKFLRKDLVVIVMDEHNEPIGFGVTMPSMTKAYKKANGKLFPFGILYMLAARKWNDTADLALIGVKEEWRKKGIHGLVFYETMKALLADDFLDIQINPMLEFNTNVLSLWKDFEHRIYKRRKTFRKVIS